MSSVGLQHVKCPPVSGGAGRIDLSGGTAHAPAYSVPLYLPPSQLGLGSKLSRMSMYLAALIVGRAS